MQLCLQEWCRALGCGSDATETPTEESGWCRTQSHCRFFFLQTRKTEKEMCYSIDKVVYLFAHMHSHCRTSPHKPVKLKNKCVVASIGLYYFFNEAFRSI